ncbi:MAG: alpha amylase C-terminal domain-containing protein [Clostridia bacterium]|nr:alpha amylase C-terminal domain-containing protein [Clostridia bacterium]
MENNEIIEQTPKVDEMPRMTEAFHGGVGHRSYEVLGVRRLGERVVFRVFLPGAARASVCGDFNAWDGDALPMQCITQGGIWEASVPADAVSEGQFYKIRVVYGESDRLIPDPYAACMQTPPDTASELRALDGFAWSDESWLSYRARRLCREDIDDRAVNSYRVDLGAWRRREDGSSLSYEEVADELAVYVKQMGYTHVEPVGICEPLLIDGMVTGAFAPVHDFGTPHAFMKFVDRMHEAGVGVILDWSVAKQLPDEISPEECSFLLSSAAFWCDVYHIDGLRMPQSAHAERVDAMLEEYFPDVLSVKDEQPPKSGGVLELSMDELRVRLLRMMTLPGKKRLVMGCELGVLKSVRDAVDWSLADQHMHAAFRTFTAELNHFYLETPALWEESGEDCIESIDTPDEISAWYRRSLDGQAVTVVINPTNEAKTVALALPAGAYAVAIDTADARFGGTGEARGTLTCTEDEALTLSLSPTSALILATTQTESN